MKDFLTKKMYATRALFFAVGVMALNVSPIAISTTALLHKAFDGRVFLSC